jgi:hypothetical protein
MELPVDDFVEVEQFCVVGIGGFGGGAGSGIFGEVAGFGVFPVNFGGGVREFLVFNHFLFRVLLINALASLDGDDNLPVRLMLIRFHNSEILLIFCCNISKKLVD